ncbi:hypothetical protein ACFL27_18870 [candidate division CSSED10-310 bacterium]|uniref:Uncharacterized protein n=1 Tax=candidate division CSSED10-310 bacterium TaxID=2855610 RepID=A0ABV6Z1C6_UNCC1
MNRRLIRTVENNFPYPIAIEFRRLNTPDFLKPDYKRLKQILKSAEKTIHFLALIGLSDLLDKNLHQTFDIPDSFRKEFVNRFTRTTFGKWIALLRDTVRVFKDNGAQFFMEELSDFFIRGAKKEAEAQKAFNSLTTIRNGLEHPNFNPTPQVFKDLCQETESYLETIYQELDFIIDYQFLFVHNVSVKYHRFQQPGFSHTLAEVVGLTNEFSSFVRESKDLLHSPSVIIAREDDEEFMSLEPLIIYSDEGEEKIADIFLYTDWDRKKRLIRYIPADKGGKFNLLDTSFAEVYAPTLLRFFQAFALPEETESRREALEKITLRNETHD